MTHANPSSRPTRASTFVLVLIVALVSVGATLWFARTVLYPQPFQPVVLDTREQATLEGKLEDLARAHDSTARPRAPKEADTQALPSAQPLEPAPYVEEARDRVIHFTQRELNAMIARDPDLARQLAVDLSDDLVSATLLITLPPDFPLFSGRTVRLATGLRVRHEQGRPAVIVEGVSLMGVPLPAAWLGGLKGRDLVALYGPEGGFWHAFSEGVQDLRVERGRLRVELAE